MDITRQGEYFQIIKEMLLQQYFNFLEPDSDNDTR